MGAVRVWIATDATTSFTAQTPSLHPRTKVPAPRTPHHNTGHRAPPRLFPSSPRIPFLPFPLSTFPWFSLGWYLQPPPSSLPLSHPLGHGQCGGLVCVGQPVRGHVPRVPPLRQPQDEQQHGHQAGPVLGAGLRGWEGGRGRGGWMDGWMGGLPAGGSGWSTGHAASGSAAQTSHARTWNTRLRSSACSSSRNTVGGNVA